MPTATIAVQYVNQPKAGKINGSIKDKTGAYYGVPPGLLSQFAQNGTYEVEYRESPFNGQVYKTISRVIGAPQTQVTPQPAPQSSAGGAQYHQHDSKDARIWVQGIVQQGIASGQVQYNDEAIFIAGLDAIKALARLEPYLANPKSVLAAGQSQPQPQPPQPKPQNHLEDEIPF